jgi:hypothetical protein
LSGFLLMKIVGIVLLNVLEKRQPRDQIAG